MEINTTAETAVESAASSQSLSSDAMEKIRTECDASTKESMAKQVSYAVGMGIMHGALASLVLGPEIGIPVGIISATDKMFTAEERQEKNSNKCQVERVNNALGIENKKAEKN